MSKNKKPTIDTQEQSPIVVEEKKQPVASTPDVVVPNPTVVIDEVKQI